MWNAGWVELRGRLTPAAHGCRLTGTMALRPFIRVLTGLQLAVAVSVALIGAWLLVTSVAQGRGAGGNLPLCLGGLGATPLVIGLLWSAGSRGWADAGFLRQRVRETLQAR